MSAAFVLLVIVSLIIVNNYPLIIVQKQILSTKERELNSSTTSLSATLQNFSVLTQENVSLASRLLSGVRGRRLIVTDNSTKVIYDSMTRDSLYNQYAAYPEILTALKGFDVFHCNYSDEAFISRAASPVVRRGEVIGMVFLYDVDTENALFLKQTRTDILGISLVFFLVFTMFIAILLHSLSRRLGTLLEGVTQVGRGNFDYKIDLPGQDELFEIANEFNTLTGQLQNNEETRRRFVSDASHELKTPLASIKLLSDSITQTENIKLDDVREFLTDISEEIDRLTGITESLLQLSKLDSLPSVKLGKCEVLPIVQKCAKLLSANAQEMGVIINISVPKNFYVLASDSGLHHVMFNLMQNAIKYNRPGGAVTVTAAADEKEMVIKVADTGIGIVKSETERIFDRFYRVDRARSRATGGTGLGLSIVNRWVKNMSGYIEVDSKIDVGSEFRVFLKQYSENNY